MGLFDRSAPNDEATRDACPPSPRSPGAGWWIALSLAVGFGLVVVVSVSTQQAGDWRHPSEPVHSVVETAGGVFGIAVAGLFLLLSRVGGASSFNAPFAAGLGVMSLLDCLHAIAPPGEVFVRWHSVATFVGGTAFALVWLPARQRGGVVVFTVCLIAGALGGVSSGAGSQADSNAVFTPAAAFLNVGGGVLMVAAALRLMLTYVRGRKVDDLLFAVICLLFAAAGILFEWSQVWQVTWTWHAVRLTAYAVALAFAIHRLNSLAQSTLRAKADLAAAHADAQRRLQRALNESRSLRLALDHNVLYSVTDRAGKIVDANAGFCRISGYSREELLGRTHRIVNSGHHPPEFWADMWRTIKSGQTWRGEVCNRAKDGALYWVDAINIPWHDASGEVECYISLRIDITEKKAAAEERDRLMEQSDEMARIIRESPYAVYILDGETLRFVDVNHGACEWTGYSREELLQMTPLDLNPDMDEASCRRNLAPILERGESRAEFPSNHWRKDGSSYPVQINVSASVYEGRSVIVAFVSDLTAVKELEGRLSRAQKLESIGELAAGVAHEINTPMQYVGDNIKFLSESSDTLFRVVDAYQEFIEADDPASWADRRDRTRRLIEESRFDRIREHFPGAIADSQEGIQRVIKIVRAMKDFSHPGGAEKSPANLNDLVDSTVSISRNRWKYTARLETRLDPNLPDAPMMASEINQVILNLVVNAADAIAEANQDQPGAIGEIEVRTRFDEHSVVLEVGDNGCGMPEHVKAKAFDPFFTTKEVGKGTGQGLAITQNVIVNQHAGEIEIDSSPGAGTTFTLRLPRDPSRKLPDSESTAREAMVRR